MNGPELTPHEEIELAEIIETDIDAAIEKDHCPICKHRVHELCNGANCETPHNDPEDDMEYYTEAWK